MRVLMTIALLAALGASPACAGTPRDDLLDAAAYCDLAGVQAALTAKADVDARSDSDVTPLMEAAFHGCTEVAGVLIAAKADVNARHADDAPGLNGATALMLASNSRGRSEIVRVLIAAGAEVNARTANGETALTNAARYGQLEAAEALVAAGADVNAQEADGKTPLAEATFGRNTTTSSSFGTIKGHLAVADFLRRHGGHAAGP
jgi:ankyrin repeat protein